MNVDPETIELRDLVKETIELVNQNAKNQAYLRGAFEQMDKRFEQMENRFEQMENRFNNFERTVNERFERLGNRIDDLANSVDRRLERIEDRIYGINSQLNSQLRWIIGLMAPLYVALIALVVKVFLG